MQPILIVYGTTEGHSRKIAEFLAERVRAAGKNVDLIDSAAPDAYGNAPIYAGALIVGSVHHQRHQTALIHFVKENLSWLNEIPTAVFSVNLTMLHKDADYRDEAQKNIEAFLEETGLKPYETHLIPGALKYTQYDFFKRALLRYLVAPGGMNAATTPDVEFTDWTLLGRYVDDFIASTQSKGK